MENVQKAQACTNCLTPGQKTQDCKCNKNCGLCNGKYNTLLHVEKNNTPNEKSGKKSK